ncbi:UNVERIFIED_CONTAM: hypothetical protein Sradi_5411200 [Sesamum radiatum]|uniref:Retrotransposon gag domain-containing protein n=1 Tax=Sesamum radiatum TaxID=300843 RepID=A0AAW2L7L8_SESRA
MNTRSRARNENSGVGDLERISEHAPQEEVQQPFGPRRDEIHRRPKNQEEREQAPPPPMIQLTPIALRQMIEDASAQAASRAIAQYVAQHAIPPRPPRHPHKDHGVDLAPGNKEQGLANQQADDQLEEEAESRPSLPEDELPPPPPKEAPLEERGPQQRSQAAARRASIEGTEKVQAFPLAVAPPRRSPFATHILAEAIQPGIKIPNINEYDGRKDPQDHLDQFLAKADLLDISNTAYCKIFRTTLAGKAMTWFNQLPSGTIDSFEQLSQRFLHHFAINKRYPKTASYLFTVIQREHESLRDYVQRFSEAVLEIPHVNPELLASIMQYKNRDPSKRRAEEEGHSKHHTSERNQRDRRRLPSSDITRYTPLNAPRVGILAVAEQQGIVQWPLHMRENPKRMKSNKYCLFHKDRGHSTEDCFHLKDEIEKLIQQGYLKEYVERNKPPREGSLRPHQDGRERETKQNNRNRDNLPTAGIIEVISGEPV